MKAAYFDKFGGPDVLQYGDVPDPVAAAERSHRRCARRERQRRRLEIPQRRICPPCAGEISANSGTGFFRRGGRARRTAHDLKVGDAVFGVLEAGKEGTYCEKIAIKAAIIAKKPAAAVACQCGGAGAHRSHRDRSRSKGR